MGNERSFLWPAALFSESVDRCRSEGCCVFQNKDPAPFRQRQGPFRMSCRLQMDMGTIMEFGRKSPAEIEISATMEPRGPISLLKHLSIR